VRPTLGKEPAAEDASPVGYLSGDTGIGLATFSYNLYVTPCLQTLRRLTFICLICPAASLRTGRDKPFGNFSATMAHFGYWRSSTPISIYEYASYAGLD
jgi:hypothetical protein